MLNAKLLIFVKYLGSAPKKNWSDWIWSESDLSNSDQIKYIRSAVQIQFKKILNRSDQFRSVWIWSKSDQFKFNPIKTDLIWQFWFKFQNSKFKIKKKCISLNISASSDHRRMQRSSLEPPRRAASNGGSFILLRPLDAEIFNETVNGAVT
jgi:hypothetical protein